MMDLPYIVYVHHVPALCVGLHIYISKWDATVHHNQACAKQYKADLFCV